MAKKSKSQGLTTSNVSATCNIDSIYSDGDESAIRETTNLLANALRNRGEGSLAALSNFLGSAILPRESATKAELGVVQQARLLINGENAHRVEVWINGYEHSEPDSQRRLLFEDMLHIFVSRQQGIQEMKGHIREARQLVRNTRSACKELRGSIKSCDAQLVTSLTPNSRASEGHNIGHTPTINADNPLKQSHLANV